MVEADLLSTFGGRETIVAHDTPAPQRRSAAGKQVAAAVTQTRRSLRRNPAPSPAA
jgi:hypothetical protein